MASGGASSSRSSGGRGGARSSSSSGSLGAQGGQRPSRFFIDLKGKPYQYPAGNVYHCSLGTQGHTGQTGHVWTKGEREMLAAVVAWRQGLVSGASGASGDSAASGVPQEAAHAPDWGAVAAMFPGTPGTSGNPGTPGPTPLECFLQYRNVDDPAINSEEWSAEEERRLLLLVRKYDEHGWCEIADELGSSRTPFECLRHYQQALNNKLINTADWTEEEDEILKAAVEQHGMGAWKQVALEVPSRTYMQCVQRWRRSLQCHESVVTGHWLPEEERLLFAAAVVYAAPRLSDNKLPTEQVQAILRAHEGGEPGPEEAAAAAAAGTGPNLGAGAGADAAATGTGTGAASAQSGQSGQKRASTNRFQWGSLADLVPGK
jgi:hypothetical protein